jgi:hypothetical protein
MRWRGGHRTTSARRVSGLHGGRGAFTLLETALAMVIVLVGVVAMVEAQRTFIRSNSWSSHEATATHLANEIRERMRTLPRHDPMTGLSLGQNQSGTPVLVGLGPEPGEVTVTDFDDIDDYDGITFGAGGQFDGPIDTFGRVIPEIDPDGNIRLGTNGRPLPLQGWSQHVQVVKVNPFDFTQALPWTATEPALGTYPGRSVDQYPLRVTVSVRYQGPLDLEPREITFLSWIVPAR